MQKTQAGSLAQPLGTAVHTQANTRKHTHTGEPVLRTLLGLRGRKHLLAWSGGQGHSALRRHPYMVDTDAQCYMGCKYSLHTALQPHTGTGTPSCITPTRLLFPHPHQTHGHMPHTHHTITPHVCANIHNGLRQELPGCFLSSQPDVTHAPTQHPQSHW